MNASFHTYRDKLDAFLSDIFLTQAPVLPQGGKDFIIKVVPWLALIGGILGIPMVLALLGLGTVVAPLALMATGSYMQAYWFVGLIAAATVILNLMAFQPLRAAQIAGWWYLWYASLLSALSSVVNLEVVSLILNALGVYLLYQIKSHYMGGSKGGDHTNSHNLTVDTSVESK